MPRPLAASRPLAVITALAVLGSLLFAGSPAATAAPATGPVVTEIAPDNTGADNFEFFEVHNPSGASLDLSAYALGYIYNDSADRSRDVPLRVPAGTVLAPGETVVLWVQYIAAGIDTGARSEQEFVDFWAANGEPAQNYRLVRVSGQPGFANGGDRGVRISGTDGTELSRSFYPAGSVAVNRTATFDWRTATGPSLPLAGRQAVATPGTPTASPSPTPTASPTSPGERVCRPGATSILQITELVVDSTNVGGSDGYEFVEITNASDRPQAYADFQLSYLYPREDLSNSAVAAWPAQPADPVLPPGGSLVLWVKNGGNQELTASDFNAFYKTSLAPGRQLVEIHSGGMANGSPRGLEIVTQTGTPINKAYYNLAGADDVDPDRGIQYATDPADSGRQRLLGKAMPSPGSTTPDQLPLCVAPPEDTHAPVIQDRTPASIAPGRDFAFTAAVSDDIGVRTVTLWLRSDVDADFTSTSVTAGPEGGFGRTVAAADLTGKRYYDYYWTAGDGTHLTTSPTGRATVDGRDDAPIGLSIAEGECLRGTATIAADARAYPNALRLEVNGADVTAQTFPTLGAEPVFAFEAGSVDNFFKNGILAGPDVLKIFEEGGIYTGTKTVSTPVPLRYVRQGDELVLSVYAGTKAKPAIDPDENNDDFTIQNLRLVLPDGRTIAPTNYTDPATVLQLGDSPGKLDFFDARFALPSDAFTALGYAWDTTGSPDGGHPVTARNGTDSLTRSACVDNTPPVIETPIVDGQTYQGPLTITATASDAGAGLGSLGATLDGRAITLPHETSSVDLPAGEHVLELAAADRLGNTATRTVRFHTPVEHPEIRLESPADGSAVPCTPLGLQATVTDPSGDRTEVAVNRGLRLLPGTPALRAGTGVVQDAAQPVRQPQPVTEAGPLLAPDGRALNTTSAEMLPYQQFEVAVPAAAGADFIARVHWEGSANAHSRVVMSVRNTGTGRWQPVAERLTSSEAPFRLEAMVPAAGHLTDGRIEVLVQHSVGFAGANRSQRDTPVTPANPQDTPRSAYDFTFGWESDTQYYNANDAYYKHQVAIHDYFLDRRNALNLQYVFHTGDIVDDNLIPHQFENADPQYRRLDEAKLPYGVLAGNHDVSQHLEDYTQYGQYFGEHRYAGNPWYGGSLQNNRGHYDLISAGGMDFVMLYMGWGPGDEQLAWMSEVARRFPERKVMISLHEYMLTTGGLGEIPQRVFDEVVKPNPNVITVFSGHYHDAYHRTDALDDDGDGTPDRTVHSVLFDYQGLTEGGQGFLRLMHFDNAGQEIVSRTYSPSLDQYNAEDPTLSPEHQEFRIAYADLGLRPTTKSLSTDAISVDVLTTERIAAFADVPSGSTLQAPWPADGAAGGGWYVVARDRFGGVRHSEVRTLRPAEGCIDPGMPGEPVPGEPVPGEPVPAGPAGPAVKESVGGLAATGRGRG